MPTAGTVTLSLEAPLPPLHFYSHHPEQLQDEDTQGVEDAVHGDGDGMGKVMRRYAGRQHLLR